MKTQPKKVIQEILDLIDYDLDQFQIDAIFQAIRKKEYCISAPRQVGKSKLSNGYSIILAIKGLKVIYLTHTTALASDMLRRNLKYFNKLKEIGIVEKIVNDKNTKEVWFKDGGCIKYHVRSPGVAVGTSWDAIVWDEAQKVGNDLVEEIVPILSQSEHRMQLSIGTPPTDKDFIDYPDSPFIQAKKRGGEGWKEFSAFETYSPDIDITDLSLAKKANPAWKRTPNFWDGLKKAQKTMSHKQYCRQYLGVWSLPNKVNVSDPYWSGEKVSKILTSGGSKALRFTAGVGILPNSKTAYISMNDGVVCEIVERFDIADGGVDQIALWLKERIGQIYSVRVPANMKGKALQEVIKEMRFAGKLKMTSLPEMSNYLSRFIKQCEEGSLKVYRATDTELAMGSFWLGYDARSGTNEIKAGMPEDAALILSLVNATVDESIVKRSESAKAFWF